MDCNPQRNLGDANGRARLAYVAVDEEPWPVHVTRFSGVAPSRRPAVRCPACQGKVTLHLGPVRVHHAAHRPGARCALKAPETALHYNAKLYLCEQLRSAIATGASILDVEDRCAGYRVRRPGTGHGERPVEWQNVPCHATRVRTWLRGWDNVDVELMLDRHRPDVTLKQLGQKIGVLEVLVSHEVTPEKAAALAVAGVPWLEVAASVIMGERPGAGAWKLPSPLRWRQGGPSVTWRCDPCANAELRAEVLAAEVAARRLEHDEQGRAAEIGRAREQRGVAANVAQPWAIRLLDLYAPDGNRTRITLEAVRVLNHGVPKSVLVRQVGVGLALARQSYVNDEQAKAWINSAFLRYCWKHAAAGRLVDSPMMWHPHRRSPELRSAQVYSIKLLPARYAWEAAANTWVPGPGMDDVRWDTPQRLDELRRLP